MSGYKRVNFYELCRLCATNQQKDKTHIFQEEGKKIQLQNKIQSCLSLSVCENDCLPKVVCSKCLRTLEVCYSFRQECVSSESMLSSYFKNFRYTEDFKKSGKVYIKDTSVAKIPMAPQQQQPNEQFVATVPAPIPEVKPMDLPFYTLQLPTIVTNHQPLDSSGGGNKIKNEAKPPLGLPPPPPAPHQNQSTYNMNTTINLATIKTIPKNDQPVVVNANGEVLNIAQLVDFESLLNVQKAVKQHQKKKDPPPPPPPQQQQQQEPVIKIDLTKEAAQAAAAAPPAEKRVPPKFAYVKVEEKGQQQAPPPPPPSVVYNHHEFQGGYSNGYSAFQEAAPASSSTVNLNALSQDFRSSFAAPNSAAKATSSSSSSNDDASGQVKSHVCEICQKSFKRREHLYQHVKLHTGFRPYTCENCNKSFMRKEHLLRHMTSHSGQKNFTCSICEKSFSRNDNLLKHKKTHDKQASYTCEVCQKQFVMKHYYLAHKLTHDGDRCALTNVWNALKT